MAKARVRTGGGGRLGRSETVTIRLDPRLNYLCELAGRVERRSKSSFIEDAIQERVFRTGLAGMASAGPVESIGHCAQRLWHVREYERLIRLAQEAPALMNFEEQSRWAVICENGYFWRGRWEEATPIYRTFVWNTDTKSLLRQRVPPHWDQICLVAAGEADPTSLPPWQETSDSITY